MPTALSVRPITDTISIHVRINAPISDVMKGFTNSVRARHHFEQFIADLHRMKKDLNNSVMLPGFGIGNFKYTEDSFRPMFPVILDKDTEALASIVAEVPPTRRSPANSYACKIWLRDSIESRKFIHENLHLTVHHELDTNLWLAVFDNAKIEMSEKMQITDCRGALIDS